jgi:predicted alpha-1,2-mannosidase
MDFIDNLRVLCVLSLRSPRLKTVYDDMSNKMQMKLISVFCIFIITSSFEISAQTALQYVNTFIGTAPASTESAKRNGSGTEVKGQTFPATGRPFGMTQWTPETRTTEDKCVSPYYYNDKLITGFRASHWMSGSCTQDYGSATLMPFTTGKPDTLKYAPVSRFSHKNETASPAYYKVQLDNFGITAEITASVRSGILRFTFPGKTPGYILIRMNSDEKQGKVWFNKQKNEIQGYNPVHRIYQGTGEPAGFSGYFVIRFDKPVAVISQLQGEQQIAVSISAEKVITAKVGTSFTGIEAAAKNLDQEIPDWDFDGVKKASEDSWNQAIGKVVIRGGTDDDRVKFYTALYHCYQLPRIVSDCDGSYQGFADDTLIHKTDGFDYYDDFSMWDTYRALHPLLTILEPQRSRDMVRSLVLKAQQGGWMPVFPAWSNYTAAMIGDHASTMIADCYLKGITGFDAETAYKFMRKNAFEIPDGKEYMEGKGRRAIESYLKYGYIPMEDSVWDAFHRNEQVSRTLEYALDDYALSRFAKALGKEDDYQTLMKRSENWKNVFDDEKEFVRGRLSNGSWFEPFDPYSRVKYICEGTPFQYTWYVPHNIPGLIKAMGGNEQFIAKLNEFFDNGFYWHGNEPDQQVPYIFAMAGQPEKTQHQVREIINSEYGTGPGGLSGNEDAGQMSAWLVFSMMGFYPVCPASDQYIITTPVFDEVKILFPGGKYFLISSLNRSPGTNYIRAISKDGGRYSDWFIKHDDITKGSRFTFQLYLGTQSK